MRSAMEHIVAVHTGRTEEQVREDIERDKFLHRRGSQGIRSGGLKFCPA